MSNQNQKDQKEKTIIRVKSAEMEGLCKSKFISSNELMDMINKVFEPVTPDYNGCNLQVLGDGRIFCTLFFAERPNIPLREGQFKVLENTLTPSKDAPNRSAGIIANHNNRQKTSRRYRLTQDAMEAFEEFIPNLPRFSNYGRDGRNILWNNFVREEQEQPAWGTQSPVFIAFPIDIEVLLGKVYGTKAEGNSPYCYLVSANRPLTSYKEPNGNLVPTSWLFLITQISLTALKEAAALTGMTPMQNTLGIYRGGMKNV